MVIVDKCLYFIYISNKISKILLFCTFTNMFWILKILIFWSGIGHIGLSLVSPMIPKMLNWKEGLKDLCFYKRSGISFARFVFFVVLI